MERVETERVEREERVEFKNKSLKQLFDLYLKLESEYINEQAGYNSILEKKLKTLEELKSAINQTMSVSRCALDLAIDEIKNGEYVSCDSLEDFYKSIES